MTALPISTNPGYDPKTLVSTDWLAARLGNSDIFLLDASWYLPDAARVPRAEYEAAHIPGARFFDIDEIADTASPLPHMAPSPEKFTSRLRSMGLGDGQQVVIYDGAGIFSAARVWWTFRLMGWVDVAVLDGGLPKWRAEGREVNSEDPGRPNRHLRVAFQPELVKSQGQVLQSQGVEIIDARGDLRFRGAAAEPRPGLRSGHIPGSRNVPFGSLLNPDGTMKSPAALRAAFAAAGVDVSKPAITTCGSGVTAAVLSLALERIGHRDHALYDGSWAEWGAPDGPDVERG